MVLVVTENVVKDRDEYMKLALAFTADIRAMEKGCLFIQPEAVLECDDRIKFVSLWESKEDWQAHVGGAAFKKHIPGMGPYYVSGTDTFYEVNEMQ